MKQLFMLLLLFVAKQGLVKGEESIEDLKFFTSPLWPVEETTVYLSPMSDSSRVIAPELMIGEIKKLMEISDKEDKELTALFVTRNNFLQVPLTGIERKRLVMGNTARKVLALLGETRYALLVKKGLIDNWFAV